MSGDCISNLITSVSHRAVPIWTPPLWHNSIVSSSAQFNYPMNQPNTWPPCCGIQRCDIANARTGQSDANQSQFHPPPYFKICSPKIHLKRKVRFLLGPPKDRFTGYLQTNIRHAFSLCISIKMTDCSLLDLRQLLLTTSRYLGKMLDSFKVIS
jgi:hypothetical protein